MHLLHTDPADLVPNPWNPNRLSPEAELRLEESLLRGVFRPLICRRAPDGSLQVLGGWHRAQAAVRLGLTTMPVLDLGVVDDARAKEIVVLDNGRYGHDDAQALSRLLEEIGTPVELASFMPFEIAEIESLSRAVSVSLDDLGLDEADEKPVEVSKAEKAERTHETLKLRLPIEDAETARETLAAVIKAQGFEGAAEEQAGAALLWVLRDWAAR